jgi:hypothetical protein
MSIFKAKTKPGDPHTIRLRAISDLDSELDAAVGKALAAGVPIYVVVEKLEHQEASARRRMAATLGRGV